LRGIGANDDFDIVGAAVTRLAALDIDDRAKAALKRTAAAGVEAGILRRHQRHHVPRQDWSNGARQFGHAVHVIVHGLCRSGRDIAQDIGHVSLGFAGEQMNSQIQRFLHLRRHFRQHGEAAADMKTAEDDRYA